MAESAFHFAETAEFAVSAEGAADGPRYYLRSSLFKPELQAREIVKIAEGLIERMNGARVALHGGQPIKFGGSARPLHQNGGQGVAIFLPPAIIRLSSGSVTAQVGSATNRKEVSDAARLALTATKDPILAQVLKFMGNGGGWFDLYKAYEVMSRSVRGRMPNLHRYEMSIDEGDERRLLETINFHRHIWDGKSKEHFSLGRCRQMLSSYLQKWIEFRSSGEWSAAANMPTAKQRSREAAVRAKRNK